MSIHTSPLTASSRWLRNIVVGLVSLAALLAGAGALYQYAASARDRRAHPMLGELIDVGGYKMHILCAGHGTPEVILDSGLGDSFLSWQKVEPQIAQYARVCSYDRAGLGYSDTSPRLRTSKVMAEELHALLQNAGVIGPFVIVGHSMGGFDARLYASLYRREVAGMVLVDASHPEQQKRLPPALKDLDATLVREQEFLAFTIPIGLPRLLGFCDPDPEVRAADCNFHSAREAIAELKSISESAAQTAATGSLGDVPLVVLSRDPGKPEFDLPEDLVEPTSKAWQQMQDELAQLSTRGTHVVAKGSGHYIQFDRPDLVIEAVHHLVKQARELAAPTPVKP